MRYRTIAYGLALAAGLTLATSPLGAQSFESRLHGFEAVTVAAGLQHPWAVAFLPDGRMLVTERGGTMRIVSEGQGVSAPLAGVPEVYAEKQGGLLDLVLHPRYADNGWIYFTYSIPRDDGARTAVARARLAGTALRDVATIFMVENPGTGGGHFGSRLAFAPDGKLHVTAGERNRGREAQNLANQNGTTLRLNDDGTVPADNPFAGRADVVPGTFTYGLRNPQGLAVHPARGEIWAHEHGPKGGDEINLLRPGANYGWPVVTFGVSYAGLPIGEGTGKPGMTPPLHQWTPSVAPSGMAFYTGDAFPKWTGNLFVGSLKFRYLARLELDDARVVAEERLAEGGFGRVRDVRQGPDGMIYLLTDDPNGRLIRLQPTHS
jgi:glucose/arabinose dehydrogenase